MGYVYCSHENRDLRPNLRIEEERERFFEKQVQEVKDLMDGDDDDGNDNDGNVSVLNRTKTGWKEGFKMKYIYQRNMKERQEN